ncbi:HNH endonuclease [Roseovarius sp. MMSF_3281]|uniref:HNH endonuclease n=1 Tax=Roseovarius sp. MMSF_3281 TaxID=3046694 RepID=UPI00273FA9F2|nr:HNH endonuclease [Roseovarius sp. MMSF_3281]
MGKLAGRGLPSRLGSVASRPGRAAGQSQVDLDRQRSQAQPWRKWYYTKRWRDLKAKIHARDGYICCQTGVLLSGRKHAPDSPVLDHKVPHRGDPALFWDETNLQTVSKQWHDSVKQSMERRGEV